MAIQRRITWLWDDNACVWFPIQGTKCAESLDTPCSICHPQAHMEPSPSPGDKPLSTPVDVGEQAGREVNS